MEYLLAWNALNTLGVIWLWVLLKQEKNERSGTNLELEKLIKKASPKMRR